MKNFLKLALILTVGLVSVVGLFLAVNSAWAVETPCFNCLPNDRETLRLKNRSTGDAEWRDPISARPSQRVGFNVYYHVNACNITARNTNIKIVYPKTNLNQITSYAYVEADNVESIRDTGTINVTGGKTKLIFDEIAYWYPDRSTTAQEVPVTFSETSVHNVVSFNLGNIGSCWDHAGYLVFEARLAAAATPTPTPTITPTPTPNPYLSINKTVRNVNDGTGFQDRVNADPNENVEFSIDVTANSNAAYNVMVRDILPSYLSFNSGSVTVNGSQASDNLVSSGINLGNLSAGQTKNIRFTARVYTSVPSGYTELTNISQAWADGVSQVEDRAYVNLSSSQQNTLLINKLVRNVSDNTGFSESVNADRSETVEFSIDVTASGSSYLNNVNVRDTLPSYLELVSGSVRVDGVQYSDSLLYSGINLGSLNYGNTRNIRFTARVASSLPEGTTVLTNVARTWADSVTEVSDRADVIVNQGIGQAALSINKVGRDLSVTTSGAYYEDLYTVPLRTLEFQISVLGLGSAASQNVVVRDTLPSGLTYVAGSTTVDGNVAADGIVSSGVNVGTINSGQTKVVKFRALVNDNSFFTVNVTKLTNSSYARGSNNPQEYSDSSNVWVVRSGQVLGATDIDTGADLNLLNAGFYSLLAALGFTTQQVGRKWYWRSKIAKLRAMSN